VDVKKRGRVPTVDMRIPREFVDLLYAFLDVAHERGVLTFEQSVLRAAGGRGPRAAPLPTRVALAAEHSEELRPEDALALLPGCFVAETLRDGAIGLDQVDSMRGLLDEMARSVSPGSLHE
jgi:hypothetical protein